MHTSSFIPYNWMLFLLQIMVRALFLPSVAVSVPHTALIHIQIRRTFFIIHVYKMYTTITSRTKPNYITLIVVVFGKKRLEARVYLCGLSRHFTRESLRYNIFSIGGIWWFAHFLLFSSFASSLKLVWVFIMKLWLLARTRNTHMNIAWKTFTTKVLRIVSRFILASVRMFNAIYRYSNWYIAQTHQYAMAGVAGVSYGTYKTIAMHSGTIVTVTEYREQRLCVCETCFSHIYFILLALRKIKTAR